MKGNMKSTTLRLATSEENAAFNSSSTLAYREVTTGQIVNLCQGDVAMLKSCREDFVLPEDFHSGLVDDFLGALSKSGIDYDEDEFWSAKPEDRALQFELIPDFLEPEDGNEVPIDSIRVTLSQVVVAHFEPFSLQNGHSPS